MYRILLVLLLLVSSFVIAQQTPGEKTIEAYNFGTLETKSGPFNAKQGGATTYHNLDPSRKLGSLNKRWGYSAVDELNDGFDSLTGIYSAYLSDGRQFLVYAADSAGVGYGGLYITGSGEDSISNASRFWKYWSPTAPTTFAMFDDKLYAMNGVQAGAVYNFDTRKAIRFPIPAPSEPIVVPIDAGDNLDGEYRYAIYVYYNGVGNIKDLGVITAPVRVSTGSVLLTGFQRPNLDSLVTGSDSIHINVYRTLANPGRLEQTDTLWRVFTSYIDTAAIDTFTIIDTLADASINHATFNKSPWSLYTQVTGLDSAGTWSYNKYGAPGYASRTDSIYSLVTDSHKVGGIYHGMPVGRDTVGVFYAATFLDTLNNIESDTGRSLFVHDQDSTGNQHTWKIRLSMPKLPDSTYNTVINLYRSHRIVVGRDTVLTLQDVRTTQYAQFQKWVEEQNKKFGSDVYYIDGTLGAYKLKMRSITADTVVNTPYYLVEQVRSDSAYFTDSTRYDSLVMQQIYRRTPPSTRLTQPFAYNGRMFGIDGSNLAWSLVDSASRWGAFDFISVNKDDGQRITLAYPTRRSIRVLKDASSYNVYQDGGGNWNLAEVTNGIGCIAPNSHAVSPAGHYYLSQDGVILETEGDFLERTYKTGLISANLDNFDKLPMSAKSKAVGTYFNHKYFLTVPIAGAADTTYVWDELAQGWATWSMPIGGAAVYDTESVAGYAPGNSMYFYYPNGKELYKYGNSLTDAGAYIWSNWTSTPFLTDEYEEAVSAIGVWFDDISSGDFIRFYDIVDGRDTVRSNLALFTDLGDTVGYREEAVASLRTGAYHQLAMWSTPDASGTWSRIDKINVSYLPLGKRTRFGETTAFVGGESGEGGAGTITFGDITGVIAGYGLSGGGLSGDVTLTVDTSVVATRAFARDSAGIGVVPDSVLYADSSGYADTAGVALNGGSTDSFYVAEATSTTTGWKQSGDTIFVDTSSGGSVDSFYVAQGDTTVIGWKQSGDTIFIDTTGGVGGGMSMDSTTAGNGLIEVSNDLAVRPGFGIDTVGDLVRIDTTETVTLYRLEDTAAAVRANIRDTVNAMGIIDSTTGGNGLIESANVLAVRPGFGIDTANDLVRVDFTDLDDTLPRYARIRDTAALMIEDSLDNYTLLTDFGKITDDSTNWNTVYTDYNTGGWETGDIAANTLDTSDMAHAPLGKLIYDSVAARGFLTSETGDISGVTAGNGLGGGGTTGALTVYANPSTTIDTTGDSIFVKNSSIDSTKIVDSSLSGKDVKRGTLALSHIGQSGAGNNQVPVWTGSAWEPQAQAALGNNPTIYGDLNLFGNPRNANFKRSFDTTYAYAKRADTFLFIRIPEADIIAAGADSNYEKYRTAHPSVVYMPGGFLSTGYRYIMANTSDLTTREQPFIRVSNDGDNWFQYCRTDSIVYVDGEPPSWDTFKTCTPDPITDSLDNPRAGGYAALFSDPDLVFGSDGKLWLYYRIGDTINPSGTSGDTLFQAIWAMSTTDLLTWTDPVLCIGWHQQLQGNTTAFWMSPSIWVDTGGTYKMWTITDSSGTEPCILLWEAPQADSGWEFVDTVRQTTSNTRWPGTNELHASGMSSGAGSLSLRHMDVIDNGADEKIVLVNVYGGGAHVGKTLDGGRTLDMRQEPFLYPYTGGSIGDLRDSAWDAGGIYRPTGVIVDRNGERVMEVFYGAFRHQAYHTGKTILWEMKPAILDFTTVAGRRKAPTDSITLIFPSWSDSSNGRIELFVDSTNQGSDTERVKIAGIANGMFVADTLVLVYKTTVAGSGSATTTNVRIDELALYGPDLSSSSYKPDSLYWNSTTDRAIDTVQTLKINIKTRDNGNTWDGAYPFQWENGSQITLWIKAALTSDEAALHVERAYLVGRRR